MLKSHGNVQRSIYKGTVHAAIKRQQYTLLTFTPSPTLPSLLPPSKDPSLIVIRSSLNIFPTLSFNGNDYRFRWPAA